MSLKRILAFSCAVLLFVNTSHAADSLDNTIVVTATRTQAKIATTPSKVNVITSKQLKDGEIIYIKDALKEIEGLSLTSNGAFGGQTSVYMRGLPTYYTKTLIDGIDVSDPSKTQPYYNFANLTPDGISRIEIVQGAQSGLYGSSAVGGVINIITKRGKGKPHLKYSQEVGSFDTYKESIESGGIVNNLSFYVNIMRFDTGGISKMDKLNTDNSYSRGDEDDSYHQTQFNTRLEYKFDNSLKIGTTILGYKTRNYMDYASPANDSADSNETPTAKSYRYETHFFMTKLYLEKELEDISIKPSIFYMQNLRYNKSIDPSWWYNKYFKSRKWGGSLLMTYKALKNTKITTDIDFKKYKVDISKDYSPPAIKKLKYNVGYFLEIEQSIKNLIIQATAREDHFSTFGNHFTYKLGANYLIDKTNTILKANYGTGFRAPSIYELYSSYGNENLNPEKSKNWDFGLVQTLPYKTNISITYFKNIIKDRIGFDMTTWKYTQKEGKTISDGFEIGIKSNPISFLIIGANYTYTASKDPDTGNQAKKIPLRVYAGYVTLKPIGNKLITTLNGRYIGKRYDDANHKHQTGKYAVFDFTVLYKPIKNLEVSVSAKNIFNRFYEEIYGYSTLPRSVFAKVSYKF
ncbi:TonB-dependent receptor plug domain-containing protein [Hippea maritima]|uniref:TonB-dependent receptor n=1 Tax=Hippea maritima (strain ATCC 700847 / DSM 10411 / MH2) TaxID=760142 RepID=F2LWK2_HIPMA|nr:TonB-dependent receptor [Hippea maritima]AEA34111.1 TonB-dependent receptor [Hippea maritima DSM 10411]